MSDNVLVRFNQARFALAKAHKIDEVKKVRDQAEALRLYVKQQNGSLEMQNQCAEIKLRAERKAGDILEKVNKHKGGQSKRTGNTMLPVKKLKDIGISKMQSSRWQVEAKIPEEKFERFIAETRDRKEEITQANLLRIAKGKPHISENSGNNEWYTPKIYIESALKVMGSIDLDPASSIKANKTVKAGKFYTALDKGEKKKWFGNVWMNPPYSIYLIEEFCKKLCDSIKNKSVKQAIVLVNNATETIWFQGLLKISSGVCFPSKRIRFVHEEGSLASPLQGQAILYFGVRRIMFWTEFSKYGALLSVIENI